MLEEIRKGLLSGLGAIFLTRDKVENIVRNMVNEAKISSDDASTLRDELLKTGEKEWSELEESLSSVIRKVLKGLDLCRRSELDNLQARVMELEQQLKEIDKQEQSPGDAV